MQSAMQMFVARFASKDPRIGGGKNAGVLQLRFRMTAKSGSFGDVQYGEDSEWFISNSDPQIHYANRYTSS
jgi:hypothetical protein